MQITLAATKIIKPTRDEKLVSSSAKLIIVYEKSSYLSNNKVYNYS